MPGLSQLQKFNADLLNLGDEVKIRSARGEKPVTVSIPSDVEDRDDSDDFKLGMPTLSEEEQAQADAAAAEMEREANDFSDITGESSDFDEDTAPLTPVAAATPDVSDLLSAGSDMDFSDLDLSDFQDEPSEPKPEPKPIEVPIEDMDLDALLAPKPKTEPEPKPVPKPRPKPVQRPVKKAEPAPKPEPQVKKPAAAQNTPSSEPDFNFSGLFDEPVGKKEESAPISSSTGDSDFDGDFESINMNDGIPSEFDGISDAAPEQPFQDKKSPEPAPDPESAPESGTDSLNGNESSDGIPEDFGAETSDSAAEDTETDIPDFSDMPDIPDFPDTTDGSKENTENNTTAEQNKPSESVNDMFNTDGLDDDISAPSDEGGKTGGLEAVPDDFFNLPEKGSEPAPDMDVPEEVFSAPEMDGVDFSSEPESSSDSNDFSFGGDDEFSIPGFSDTVTADLEHKPKVETPDYSGAMENPKNSFTDAEYKRFQKNLSEYPLNVRIALEELVVKDEFTDDAVFSILEKVLRKVPARSLASDIEKMLDITLEVPRDFERRSAAEYEAYKKSMEYQLKNRIIPGAILTAFAAVMVFCIFTLTNVFIYKPARASSLYRQGYTLLEAGLYPQADDKFNTALTYHPSKKWFYRYASGFREHKQYERSRLMYKSILSRYRHEIFAGLDWADMELYDLYNYEEAERIIKREVLDYHINDERALLKLGDVYLEWATERDQSKFPLADEQYTLLINMYGSKDLYLSRKMRYSIRTDNLAQVLSYKEYFYPRKKALGSDDLTELSGYLLDKRFGHLRPSEAHLRSSIEDVRDLLERAVKADDKNAVALYNMGRYYRETSNSKGAAALFDLAIEQFEAQKTRSPRDTYKFINAYRFRGEEYKDARNYIPAEETYAKGLELFERERENAGFKGTEDVGRLYADMGDIYYFVAGDPDKALSNYVEAVNNSFDTSSVRYKIGNIQYHKKNYPAALGSFIRSQDASANDTHLLLALANTLSLSGDNFVARGYYERLLGILDSEKERHHILFPQVREDQADLVDTYMRAANNLGVTLTRIAGMTGDSSLNAQAIVNYQNSMRAWDALTRNQTTMIRMEGSNLAEQNVKYTVTTGSEFNPEIYTQIPRTLYGEDILE